MSNISNRCNTSLPSRPPRNPNIKTTLPSIPQLTLQSFRRPVALTCSVSTSLSEMKTKQRDRGSTESSLTPRLLRVKSSLYSQAPVKKTSATRFSLRSLTRAVTPMLVPMGSCINNSSKCSKCSPKYIKLRSNRAMFNSSSSSSWKHLLRMRGRRWKWRRRGSMGYSCSNRWLNSNRNLLRLNLIKEGEEEEVLNPIKPLNKIQANSSSNSSNRIGSSTINNPPKTTCPLLNSNFNNLSLSMGSNNLNTSNRLLLCISSRCNHNSNSLLSSTIKCSTLLKWCHNSSNNRQLCNSHLTHPIF